MTTKAQTTENDQKIDPVSNELLLTVGRKLFEFTSEAQWANKARSWYGNCGVHLSRIVTIDAKGRIVVTGREFARATKDDSYPVSVYEID